MSEKEKILVRYLLGDLAEDSKRRVEEEYFENDDYHGQLLAVERDLIDRYVHEELSDKERKLFEKHFLSSPVRLQRVQFATALMKYCSTRRAGEKIGRSNSGRFRLSIAQTIFASKLRLAVAAVIVVGLGLGVWLAFFYQLGVDRGMAVLREVYRSNRPLQARVSMLDYARSAAERGGEPYIDDRRRRRAELIISEEVEDRPTPQAHHALGVVYLADRQFDQAIKEFQAALNDDPKNARLYSDLGVAFFEKGKLDRSKGESDLANKELTQSLEWLNKALSADGSLLEALFNIALLHQMILPHQAEEDWRRYLEKDSTSPWAEEARENLEQLQNSKRTSKSNEQILQEFLDSFRSGDEQRAWEISKRNREPISGRLIFWQLLESCLSLKANGRHDEAREKIDALAYAGNLESAKTGDNYVRDLAMLYQSASPKQLSLLWKAHDLMNKGHRQCSQSKYKDAIILYDLSGRAFEEAGSRWEARYADYWTGYCLLQSAQKEKALSMLENLSATFEKQGYLWLSALSFNSLANANAVIYEYSMAIDCTKKSLELSKRLEDSYNTQKNLAQLAFEYRTVGNFDQALIYIHRCLESASDDWPGARQMWRNYETMAQTLSSTGRFAAAADYEREALHLALEEIKDPSFIYVSYVHLGMIYGELDRFDEGVELAERGCQAAESLIDKSTRLKATGYCSLMLGHLNREVKSYDTAVACYDRAIENYNEIEYPAYIYNAHKGRFISYLNRGDDRLAREELQTVLSLLKQYRARIKEESNRNAFLEAEQNVYDNAIEFAHSRMRKDETAFEYSELARSRSLLDLITTNARFDDKSGALDIDLPRGSEPMKFADIRKRLPDKVQILQYDALDDKLLIWVVSKTKFEVREQPIILSELDGKIRRYLKAISNPGDAHEVNDEAKELYAILIAPIETLLDPARQLCIVPDKILNLLPFASLISPASNQYLVSSYLLSFSSSSTVLIMQSETARRREGSPSETILSVGNPTFNTRKYASLSALPESAEEAEEAAKFYDSPKILVRGQATKNAVSSAMPSYDVIHLASHYIADKQSAMLSKLLLAADAGEGNDRSSDGELQACEVYAMKLSRPRLAVLSACRTGVEKYYDGEGMIGMSRTFIAAGVPLVVASLWPVDSIATKELMLSFHRHRKTDHLSTARALRAAQLDMLANSNHRYAHPYYWASFALFGGYAGF